MGVNYQKKRETKTSGFLKITKHVGVYMLPIVSFKENNYFESQEQITAINDVISNTALHASCLYFIYSRSTNDNCMLI